MASLVRSVVLGFVLVLAGLAAPTGDRAAAATPDVALRKIHFDVKTGARDRFFAAMRAFSTKFEFKIDIAQKPKGRYALRASHGDVRMVGSNADDRNLFTISFYAANQRPISQVYLDVLLIDLKAIPRKTPGVTLKPNPDGSIN